jgi:hypothetical protein
MATAQRLADVRTPLERLGFNKAAQEAFDAQGINSIMTFNTIQNDGIKRICKLLRERAVDPIHVMIIQEGYLDA